MLRWLIILRMSVYFPSLLMHLCSTYRHIGENIQMSHWSVWIFFLQGGILFFSLSVLNSCHLTQNAPLSSTNSGKIQTKQNKHRRFFVRPERKYCFSCVGSTFSSCSTKTSQHWTINRSPWTANRNKYIQCTFLSTLVQPMNLRRIILYWSQFPRYLLLSITLLSSGNSATPDNTKPQSRDQKRKVAWAGFGTNCLSAIECGKRVESGLSLVAKKKKMVGDDELLRREYSQQALILFLPSAVQKGPAGTVPV